MASSPVPAQRGAQVDQPVLGARLAHPAPLGEGERRRLDRPAVHRRHQEPRGVVESRRTAVAAEGEGDHGHRGVLDLGQLGGGRRRDPGEQPGASARPGWPARRRPPRSARARRSGRPPARTRSRCAPARGRWRRARTSTRPASASASRASPPGSPAKTGTSTGRQLARRAAARGAARRHQLRHGRPRREPPGVAGVHPAEQRLDQPVHDLVAEPAGDQVADRDVLVDGDARAARPATRASPSSDSTPAARSSARSSGTPISERGSGRSAPRVQIRDDCTARVHDLEAELAGQVDALGPPVEHRLGADVDDHAADLGRAAACRRPPATASSTRRRRRAGARQRRPRSARRAHLRRPRPAPAQPPRRSDRQTVARTRPRQTRRRPRDFGDCGTRSHPARTDHGSATPGTRCGDTSSESP